MEAIMEWLLNYLLLSSLILTVIIIYIIHKFININQNLPPGPVGLPIVGCLPFVGRLTPEKICHLKKKYGSIFGLYLGSRYTIVLTDYPSIKEALNNFSLLARPTDNNFDILDWFKFTKSGFGGKYWIEQRRFMMNVLRDLGVGKSNLEEFMMNEISFLIKELKSEKGKPNFTNDILASSIRNIICFLVLRKRFEFNSEKRKSFGNAIEVYSHIINQTAIQIFIPWLRPILVYTGILGYKQFVTASKVLYDFIEKEIEEHEKTLDVDNIRDYVDHYLIELQNRQSEDQSYFSRNMMKQTTLFLLSGGSTTVYETLAWAFLIMAKYQNIQKQVQQEIDDVIGKHRQPTWADNLQLPYTQAVICEIQRWKTLVPINMLRYCAEETKIQRYRIPKGSIIMTDILSVHNDLVYWKDPEVFRPERFLDETGKKLIRHDFYIPFSIGKLSCPGENLAKIETFLIFVTVMQQFTIKPPEGENLDMEGIMSLTYAPKPQKLCFLER